MSFNSGGVGFNNGAAVFQNGVFQMVFRSNRIYCCGEFTNYNGVSANRIVALNMDGSMNLDFVVGTGFNSSCYTIVYHNGYLYAGGNFTTYKGVPASRIAMIDYFGDKNDAYFGNFNGFVMSMFPIGNKFIIGGNFTQFNGGELNRISFFGSKWKSITFEVVDLDLKEELQFPLSYNLSDITQPQNRKSDFSKTITLPGTDNNNRVLSQIYEIGSDSSFNPNKKTDVIVLTDGLEIFKGFMKLERISSDILNELTYEIKISGRLIDIFTKFVKTDGEDLNVSDLDFSDYTHPKTRQILIESWNNNIKKDGTDYKNFITGPTYSVTDTGFYQGGRTIFQLTTAPVGIEVGDNVRFIMNFPGIPSINFNQSQGHHTVIDVGPDWVAVNLEFRPGAPNSGQLVKWVSKGEGYVYPTINYNKDSADLGTWSVDDFKCHFYLRVVS